MIRLVQLRNGKNRRAGLVEEPDIRLFSKYETVYALAWDAIATNTALSALATKYAGTEKLNYDSVYSGKSDWKMLAPVDHPDEPARCLVSGTGLTHFGSAKNRQAMHEKKAEEETDSMKMFRWGMESGRPAAGKVGIPPEWFYKGSGTIVRAPSESLDVPAYAEDGGEEAEMVGVYLIGPDGQPHRLGFAPGNEFADHKFEKKNYLNLAGSKIRTCSFGPELVVGAEFKSVPGKATIERAGKVLWSKEIATGEGEMTHSLANVEHHHFKFETHRRAGDVHIHYFGAHSLSFGDGVQLGDGDIMEVAYPGFGRPLRNPVKILKGPESVVTVKSMA